MTTQLEIILPPLSRGFHLVTRQIERNLPYLPQTGMLNIFVKHTSAGITLNENADPTVRSDFERFFARIIPDGAPFFEHREEGDDDMPSHVKSSMVGHSVTIPITDGKLNLGIWQGIYLCEFRNQAPARKLVITILH